MWQAHWMAKFSARIPAFHATTIYESNSTRKPKRSSSKESAAAAAAGFLSTSQGTVQWYFYLNLSHFLVSSQEMGQIGTFFHFTIIAHIFDLYAKVLWRMLFSKFVLGHFFKLQLQNMADFQS